MITSSLIRYVRGKGRLAVVEMSVLGEWCLVGFECVIFPGMNTAVVSCMARVEMTNGSGLLTVMA